MFDFLFMSYLDKNHLEKKWWHRLVKVVIYIVTFVVFLLSIFFIYQSKVHKVILNFEAGYEQNGNQEKSIQEVTDFNTKSLIIVHLIGDNESFWSFHPSALREDISKIVKTLYPTAYQNFTDSVLADHILNTYSTWQELIGSFYNTNIQDYKIFDAIIDTDFIYYYKFKEWDEYSFSWVFLAPFVYLILSGFYYKIILYVVYGKPSLCLKK